MVNKQSISLLALASGIALALSFAPMASAQATPQPTQVAQSSAAPAAQPTPQQRAAMLKQWLQASQAQMRTYEWIETTVVSKDGEEKSRSQKRCYYGVDGKLQKIELQSSAQEGGGPPGITPLGRIAKKVGENKKEQMAAYMQDAVALVHSYVPPNPGTIQGAINAGKLSVAVLEPGPRIQLNFKDYLKPGDSLGVEIETPTNRLLGMSVASYLDAPSEAVSLNVKMSLLPDGTFYAEQSVLEAKAKGLSVTVHNEGYRRMNP